MSIVANLPPGRFTTKVGEYLFDECPGCGKPEHFWYNTEKGQGKCFSCGAKITHRSQLKHLNLGSSIDLAPLMYREPTPKLLDTPSLWDQNAYDHAASRGFLMARGISERISRFIPFHYLVEERALVVGVDPVSPEYPKDYVYRYPNQPDGKWMPRPATPRSLYGFGLEAWEQRGLENVIITEGIFDVLSPGLHGHAVAVLGTQVSDAFLGWLRLHVKGQCIIWTDADTPGRKAARQLYNRLYVWGLKASVYETDRDPKQYSSTDREVRKVLAKVQ